MMLLVVALIAGTFCALVTKSILNSIPEEQEEAAVAEEKTVPVMVAKRDLLPGDEVTPQNIRFDRLPESQVPSEAVNRYSDAKNRVLKERVGKGQLINIYNLEEPKPENGYTGPNTKCVSFMIGSVVGKGEDAEKFLGDIRRSIVPNVDKADFSLVTEVREDNSPDGAKPLRRTSTVEPILDNVDIYRVRVVQQQEAESDTSRPRLELSFILDNDQCKMLEEAASRGRITIGFTAGQSEEEQVESPLLKFEPLVTPVSPLLDSAEPEQEESFLKPTSSLPQPTSAIFPPSNSPPVPTQTVEAAPAAPAEKPEPAETAERPRMSIPRPRVSIPRPDVAL